MVHNDVTVVHNPTDSALMDLAEVSHMSLACAEQMLTYVVTILEDGLCKTLTFEFLVDIVHYDTRSTIHIAS